MTSGHGDPPATASLRRRGNESRRRQLAALAGKLIRERGFEGLSVNDLADGAGISVGGMYRYIRTKSDLLVMACEDIYGDMRERIVAAAARHDDAESKLRKAMQVYLAACEANRDLILLMYREYRHLPAEAQQRYKDREEKVAEVFATLVRSGVRRRAFRSVDPDLIAHDIVFLGHFPALKHWTSSARVSPARLAAAQIDLIVGYLSP